MSQKKQKWNLVRRFVSPEDLGDITMLARRCTSAIIHQPSHIQPPLCCVLLISHPPSFTGPSPVHGRGYQASIRLPSRPRREPEREGAQLEQAFRRRLSARTPSLRFTQICLTRIHTVSLSLSQHSCFPHDNLYPRWGQWSNATTGTRVTANVYHVARITAQKLGGHPHGGQKTPTGSADRTDAGRTERLKLARKSFGRITGGRAHADREPRCDCVTDNKELR